jgi:hypothetical protein
MAKINQKGMIPIIAAPASPPTDEIINNPSIDNRLAITSFMPTDLDATPKFRVYFASGQAPNGMSDTQRGYQNPLAWSKPNSLLTVPQQVWLCVSSYFGPQYEGASININPLEYLCSKAVFTGESQPGDLFGTVTTTAVWADGTAYIEEIKTYNAPAGSNIPTEVYTDSGTPGVAKYKAATAPNLTAQENTRIGNIYQQVQEQIQILRPGRTWVDVVDYTNGPLPNNVVTDPDDSYDLNNRYPFMIAPNSNEKFFGTNFLHIYAGIPFINAPDNPVPNPQLTDQLYINCKAQIVGSYSKFAGYNVQLFSMDADGTQQALNTANMIPIAAPPSCNGGTLNDYTDGTSSSPVQVNLATALSNAAKSAMIQNQGPLITTYYEAVAADLSNYGYTYGGDSSKITVGYLINLIASTFKFNPQTGEDL